MYKKKKKGLGIDNRTRSLEAKWQIKSSYWLKAEEDEDKLGKWGRM